MIMVLSVNLKCPLPGVNDRGAGMMAGTLSVPSLGLLSHPVKKRKKTGRIKRILFIINVLYLVLYMSRKSFQE